MESTSIESLADYGSKIICYVMGVKDCHSKNSSLTIVKAKELIELDGGRELMRTLSEELPDTFELNGEKLDFNIIYSTPECKPIVEIAAKKYRATLVMLF